MDGYTNIGHNVTKLLRVAAAERCVPIRFDNYDSQIPYYVDNQ